MRLAMSAGPTKFVNRIAKKRRERYNRISEHLISPAAEPRRPTDKRGDDMNIVCLDMEGVLVPEIWIAFAEASGIPELRRTTRD